jgi:hypothetical protein
MSVQFNTIGIIGFGAFYGYVLLFIVKRCLPPTFHEPPSMKSLTVLLTSVGLGSIIGTSTTSIDGINYIAAYGLGLCVGLIANIIITLIVEFIFYTSQAVFDISFDADKSKRPEIL